MINQSNKLTGPFLIGLKNRFREISGADMLIDKLEFRNGLDISDDISDRLFDIFDKDKNGSIDYKEFIDTIESMIGGTEEEKIKFAFELHDLDNNGYIDRGELKILIKQSLAENRVEYDDFQLQLLVDEFFDRADKDFSGTIDFDEFLGVVSNYPDFMEGFAVNPLHWLLPDRINQMESIEKRKLRKSEKVQVQDIGVFRWLLIPRLIFLYNILVNRKKNHQTVGLQSIKLLPSKVLELTITPQKKFNFNPGDYIYMNCSELSDFEWYPFNILRKTEEHDIVLHIKNNNTWVEKLHDTVLAAIGKDTSLNWNIRIDGPYGSSSQEILNAEHPVIVGVGHGISKIAPILQDIIMRVRDGRSQKDLKRIDLYWLIHDETYFEWFTKLLFDLNRDDRNHFFKYHIYFMDRKPEDMTQKIMYITTNIRNKKSRISMVENQSSTSRFGLPDWDNELKKINLSASNTEKKIFYCGPSIYKKELKRCARRAGIEFKSGSF